MGSLHTGHTGTSATGIAAISFGIGASYFVSREQSHSHTFISLPSARGAYHVTIFSLQNGQTGHKGIPCSSRTTSPCISKLLLHGQNFGSLCMVLLQKSPPLTLVLEDYLLHRPIR